MKRIFMIRTWLLRELEAERRGREMFRQQSDEEVLLEELLAVIDKWTKR